MMTPPPPCAIICFAAACTPKNAPFRLMPMTSSNSCFGDLQDVLVAGDAGIVDHDVEPAELLHGGRDELIDVSALGDIADDGAQGIRPPELGGRLRPGHRHRHPR